MKLMRVWCGPMCAAKTTGALHAARRYARHGKSVVLVRPGKSKRGHESHANGLVTKNGEEFPSYDLERAGQIPDLLWKLKVDVVWIDEPNHFPDEALLRGLVPEIREASIVLVSGLGATSELEPFGSAMAFLLATADRVHWLSADCDICKTHGTATRSLYVGEAPKDQQLKVGGAESYRPACPSCWTEMMALDPSERQ